MKTAVYVVLAIGVAAVLYVIAAAVIKPNTAGGLQSVAKGGMAKLQVLPQPIAAAAVPFTDASGKTVHLTDFKGQTVVLNLWATWCAPCVKEMPTLAKLQSEFAGKPVKVLAVSMDSAPQRDQAMAFMAKHPPLAFYQDSAAAFLSDFNPHPEGFPTTVLIDGKGFERAIYSGDADWSSADAKAVVERLAAG